MLVRLWGGGGRLVVNKHVIFDIFEISMFDFHNSLLARIQARPVDRRNEDFVITAIYKGDLALFSIPILASIKF